MCVVISSPESTKSPEKLNTALPRNFYTNTNADSER